MALFLLLLVSISLAFMSAENVQEKFEVTKDKVWSIPETWQRRVARNVRDCASLCGHTPGCQAANFVKSIDLDVEFYCEFILTLDSINLVTSQGEKALLNTRDVDQCAVDLCLNGATCVDGHYSYTCHCANGYSGDHCETVSVLHVDGVTCTHTSAQEFPCSNVNDQSFAIPGGEWNAKAGNFLTITFPRPALLTSITVWSKCITLEQFERTDLDFSDGQSQTVDLLCTEGTGGRFDWADCDGVGSITEPIASVTTTYLTMTFRGHCDFFGLNTGDRGLREIYIGGYFP